MPGTSATINKLVSADPTAGYFYGLALGSGDVAVNVETLSAADATGLPTGITHAAHLSSPVVKDQTVLFGFNFRPNNGKAWQYVDASQYAGITFWAKVGGPMLLSVGISSVDATNIAESEEIKGACPASTRSDCTGIHSTETTIPTTWQQFKLHWADLFATGLTGDVDPKRLYRYDIIHTATESETKYDLFVTGIKFATAAELN